MSSKSSKSIHLSPENSDGNGCYGYLQDRIQVVTIVFANVEVQGS